MQETRKEAEQPVSATAGYAIPKRILVADDNKAIRDIVSEVLEFIGYEVDLAINGIEALAFFLKSSFDLVVTDLEMPVMDGLSLADRIKVRSPCTPVILITGGDRETVLKKVERWPVDSVIFKPFTLEELEKTVRGALVSSEREQVSVGAEKRLKVARCQTHRRHKRSKKTDDQRVLRVQDQRDCRLI